MATTNLLSQSLGDILVETGNGTPNHTSPSGAVYTDQDTGFQYLNLDGSTTWSELILSAHGELFRNATTTVSPSTTGWTELTTNLISRNMSGITVSGGRLVVGAGLQGTYGVMMSVSIQYNNTNSSYILGVSKNQAVPASGQSQTTSVASTRTTANASIVTTVSLVSTDTVSYVIQAGSAGNVNILYSNLFIWRKGD